MKIDRFVVLALSACLVVPFADGQPTSPTPPMSPMPPAQRVPPERDAGGTDLRTLARSTAADAEDLVAHGRHGEAAERATNLASRCAREARRGDEAAVDCQVRAWFTLGFVERSWAAADPQRRDAHLGRAADAYRRAHALRPEQRQILAALVAVLRDAGKDDEAARTWQSARGRETASFEDKVLLGDLELAAGRVDAARRAYFEAERKVPADVDLHRRILVAYSKTPGSAKEHMEWCRRLWKLGLDGVATQGLELFLRDHGDDPDASEWALLYWADLRSERGTIDSNDVAALPTSAARDAHRGLRALVAGPLDELSQDASWWRDEELRQHVAAKILRGRSRRAERAGDPEQAVGALLAAKDWAPAPWQYGDASSLAGRTTTIWTLVVADLAALYQRLDAQGPLDDLISEIFLAKGDGYLEGDDQSVYRCHTVLGLIYSEQERWHTEGFDNARFQLTQALRTADRIAATDGKEPPPLPHLQDRLGRTWEALDQPKRAAEAYAQAAQGYLRLDDLPGAAHAVRKTGSLSLDPMVQSGLETVLADRTATAAGRLDAAQVAQGRTATWITGDDPVVLRGLPESFVQNQRFKIQNDLAAQAEKAGDAATARLLATRAQGTAVQLEVQTDVDKLRYEKLEHTYEQLQIDPDARLRQQNELRLDAERLDAERLDAERLELQSGSNG